jgi:hypothetical protein
MSVVQALRFYAVILVSCCGALLSEAAPLLPLKVSENHRYLVDSRGQPFFYLGDTAWELFHRLNREDAIRYLDDRAKKGFTVQRL